MVTVIIPAYNHPELLTRALYSLAAQTAKDFCVLVSDDCSQENLKAVCDNFKALNLTYIRSEKNQGCGGNRKFALDFFKKNPTEYLMWLDSDDVLMPNAIERLEKIIEHNNADFIATDINVDKSNLQLDIIKAQKSKTWLHGKIYRTQFLIDNKIDFPLISSNEDLAFNMICYGLAKEVYNINEVYYLWYNNKDSLTRCGNDKVMQQLVSTDYIEAFYYAYCHLFTLNSQFIANILMLYNKYQDAVIYGLIKPKHNKMIKEMLHSPKVMRVLVELYFHPDANFEIRQWTIKDESIVFYNQTFGQWINKFISVQEMQQAIKTWKNNKKDL